MKYKGEHFLHTKYGQPIAELFDRDKSVIFKYSKNIFEEGELVRDSVVAQNATTAADWKTYMVDQQYRQRIDQQPSEVDKHPAEAIEKLGKIEGKAKP